MHYFLTNILSSVFGTGFLIVFYIIQIVKSVKVKSAKGISWIGWSMLNLALLCMFGTALSLYISYGTYGMLVTETANVVLALIELFLILKYRKYDEALEFLSKQKAPVKQPIGFSANE